MAFATSERRRGASHRSPRRASFTGRPDGITTCTRRCPQSGAGDTSSTNRSVKPSVCRSTSARFSARCTCRHSCRAFRSTCRPDETRSDVPPLNAWANSGSTKSAAFFERRLRCFKTELPCGASTRARPVRRHVRVAVNLVAVECDGSRPGRPDYSGGGGQARRHRAACNRGHGLLRCCVEFEGALRDRRAASAGIITREPADRQSAGPTFDTATCRSVLATSSSRAGSGTPCRPARSSAMAPPYRQGWPSARSGGWPRGRPAGDTCRWRAGA